MTDLQSTLDALVAEAPLEAADWNDVVARATRPQARRLWRRSPLLVPAATAIALAAAIFIALSAPWNEGSSFTDRALAALGAERYARVEVEPPDAHLAALVDIATGTGRAASVKRVYWYDSRTSRFNVWYYVDGVAVGSGDLLLGHPGLAAFLGGYRAALADGSAKVVGESGYQGRKVKIVQFEPAASYAAPSLGAASRASYTPGTTEDVAVDSSTYQPRWFRLNEPKLVQPATKTHAATVVQQHGPIFRIIGIASAATPATRPASVPDIEGDATNVRSVSRSDATSALGHAALWPGRTIGNLTLRSARLERLTTYRGALGPVIREGLGLHLVYRAGQRSVEIFESPSPQAAYGFMTSTLGSEGTVAPPGKMRISCRVCSFSDVPPTWSGQLQQDGLFISIYAPSRDLLLAAARSLRPTR
jgi:hypothetical protein